MHRSSCASIDELAEPMSILRARGWSMLELMLALAIASLTLTGAFTLLAHGRELLDANESVSRLQDQARHAMSVVTQDLEHAGFFGFGLDPAMLLVVRDGDLSRPVARGAALRQDASHVPLQPTALHDCGVNFAFDLATIVEAANNGFALGIDAPRCTPTASAGGAASTADTLTVRRVSSDSAPPMPGKLQIYSRRFGTQSGQALFSDGRAPGPIDADRRVFDVVVRTYYIARNSVERAGWPALRAKTLTSVGGEPRFRDEEILPGVEDLQVQFGIADTALGNFVTRFVDPDAVDLRGIQPLAVRVWLRIRAESTERGFRDNRAWSYADVEFMPSSQEQGSRRTLVSRTVMLRNRAGSPSP
jgi:type IV pilus assembly protein PilW